MPSQQHRRAPFDLVSNQSLSEQVAQQIVRRILRGDHRPGERLPTEGMLCQQLGVSRSVVREAVSAVSVLGLVSTRQGSGIKVNPPELWNEFSPGLVEARKELGDADDVLTALLELRRIIEIETAGLAALRRTEENIRAMEEGLWAMREGLKHPSEFIRLDIAFHESISRASGNLLLAGLLQQIRPTLVTQRKVGAEARAAGVRQTLKEHERVFDAVRRRSSEAAKSAMAIHLSWSAGIVPTPSIGGVDGA